MSDTLQRLNAALEGRYRVDEAIGEGGMALIYAATDLRHGRRVALKVLKPHLAAVVGSERFLTEVRTTASLQHPGILPLYDSGDADGILYYVMPFVEGESLREVMARVRQLSVPEAVDLTTQVCEALQSAHQQGVVHRDIKPENILIYGGRALVADFGIALALSSGDDERMTETGISLGTPHYVSPEQASGDQDPTARSDIYSLACVLYEMLVGEPPFSGNSAQAVLMRILGGRPPSARETRPAVPLNVDAALRCALERVPADRFASARDFAAALRNPDFRYDRSGAPADEALGGRHGRWVAGVSTAVAIAAVGASLYFALTPDTVPAPLIRYAVHLDPAQAPAQAGQPAFGTSLSLSADGSRLVYVGPSETGESRLWLLERSGLSAVPIPGTEGVHQPALSPDGRAVAAIALGDRTVRAVSLGAEPPVTLVEAELAFRLGLDWGRDGYVYFSARPDGGIARVPEEGGGEIELLSVPDTAAGERRHAWPQLLPGGRGVLVTVLRGDNEVSAEDDVGVLDLATGHVRVLFRGFLARYEPSGHLIFVTRRGALMAVPFDEHSLEVAGVPVEILSGVRVVDRGPDVALAASGRLVYEPDDGSSLREIAWVDRRGLTTSAVEDWMFTPEPNSAPALSPDERSIAVSVSGEMLDELWVQRLGGTRTRLGSSTIARHPVWSADGERLLYSEGNGARIVERRADAIGGPRVVAEWEQPNVWGASWADGERWVVFQTFPEPARDILARRLDPEAPTTPLLATEFDETSPRVSPDGRFLAYVSNESGRPEVYVRPFPDVEAARFQLSDDGGREPVWAYGGRELFYKNAERAFVALDVSTTAGFQILGRRTLFQLPDGASYNAERATYDVSRDGRRFLMLVTPLGDGPPDLGSFLVIEGFPELLRDRLSR